MTDNRTYDFDEQVLAVALHRSQRCKHGVGPDPKPVPKDYLKVDHEWAADIAEEYRIVYAELEEAFIEKTMEELVEMGLVERVPA